ncbi:hypothetical protein [Nocardia gipuzkoensis]
MPDTIIISPDQLRSGGAALLTARDAFHRVLTTLSERVHSHTASTWGRDAYGREFADGDKGYLRSRANLIDGTRDMVTTVGQFGDGLIAAGRTSATAEANSTAGF